MHTPPQACGLRSPATQETPRRGALPHVPRGMSTPSPLVSGATQALSPSFPSCHQLSSDHEAPPWPKVSSGHLCPVPTLHRDAQESGTVAETVAETERVPTLLPPRSHRGGGLGRPHLKEENQLLPGGRGLLNAASSRAQSAQEAAGQEGQAAPRPGERLPGLGQTRPWPQSQAQPSAAGGLSQSLFRRHL